MIKDFVKGTSKITSYKGLFGNHMKYPRQKLVDAKALAKATTNLCPSHHFNCIKKKLLLLHLWPQDQVIKIMQKKWLNPNIDIKSRMTHKKW